MNHSRHSIGRSGEFLVMARLSVLGYYCVHSDSYSDDVWIKLPDGSLRTIQVKTVTYSTKRRSDGLDQYMFTSRGTDADFYALVALDIERILFRTVRQFKNKTIRVPVASFSEHAERKSLHTCLKSIER